MATATNVNNVYMLASISPLVIVKRSVVTHTQRKERDREQAIDTRDPPHGHIVQRNVEIKKQLYTCH